MKYAASFIGWSNTGKTSLIEAIISSFIERGCRVSALKQSHVEPDFDTPSKDTDRFFRSGAAKVGYFSPGEGFLRFHETPAPEETAAYFEDCDVLLCEGFHYPGHPLFEVVGAYSAERGLKCDPASLSAYIFTGGEPADFHPPAELPVFDAGDPQTIINYLEDLWKKK
ncbi:MAG: molybdopterin-guanine dinucleotide biosynthesis protein B [Sediminispirochaetaceae bacterium]